ncbi:NAD-dependent epimerase/dehydratase family protein [Nocardia sp. NPDC058058]|uniref:NAD-dependent epimerase/dehydratase family protein n=1 Tax=Nocardia sp. NPDC058058 TaxID=3346317 RepID=UPI0036DD28B3
MPLHIVIGAGPVGTATALRLATGGERVRLLTRHGSGPDHPGITRIAADATDAAALAGHCAGASAVYQCAQPAYHRWPQEFPALHRAVLTAAESSDAVLVTVGNLYGYGEFTGPVAEDQPMRPNSVKGRVRADMWAEQLAAHEAGRIRTAEVRGSDYLGPHAVSAATTLLLPAILSGRRALVPADLDAPHTWTATTDVARLLIAVAADENAWGRAWHVPSAPPLSVRALADLLAKVAGASPAKVMRMPAIALRAAGLFVPAARELRELRYQFDRPFIMDSGSATRHFDLNATPIEESLRETVEAFRGEAAEQGLERRR